MTQVTNYTSGLNRRSKSHTQRWVVQVFYTDSSADTQYPYRTEAGARRKAADFLRGMAEPAKYGYDSCPIIRVELKEVK